MTTMNDNAYEWAWEQLQALQKDPESYDHNTAFYGDPLLIVLSTLDEPEWVATALDLGAPRFAQNFSQRQAIHCAAQAGDLETVQVLLKHGVNVDEKDGDSNTPLHLAASINWEKMVAFLLEQGANTEARTLHGQSTPLMMACMKGLGGMDSVEALLQAGADVEAVDKYGNRPLSLAIRAANSRLIERLLGAKADPNGGPALDTLHLSVAMEVPSEEVKEGWPHPFDQLLKAGANPRIQAEDGSTLLHFAAQHGELLYFQALLGLGADPMVRNQSGQTALDVINQLNNAAPHPDSAFRDSVLTYSLPAPTESKPRFRF